MQSARIDLDKGCETTRKKAVSGSGEAASLLIGNWRKPLRLTLESSTLKKLHSQDNPDDVENAVFHIVSSARTETTIEKAEVHTM